jgi:hypothetical protein
MTDKMILKAVLSTIFAISLFAYSSCTKTADKDLTKAEKQDTALVTSAIDDKEFTESYEDLTTVDYRDFYEQLTPHGEWVQVSSEDIGLKPNTASNARSGKDRFLLSNLLGLNDAQASAPGEVNMIYVWKPSNDLGVVTVEGKAPKFMPYTNGQWVHSDAGWYFKAPTPAEEIVSHFGRWVQSETEDWLWVPGRVWAPAWVDWKQNDNYVSWAPLPPSSFISSQSMNNSLIDDSKYVVVERKYFLEPAVYKYYVSSPGNVNTVLISELARTGGITILNNTIINQGPDVNVIQNIYGRVIEQVKIKRVVRVNDVSYSEKDYKVYCPGFKRIKNKNKSGVMLISPQNYVKYDDWKSRGSANNGKGNDKINNGSGINKKYESDDNDSKGNGNYNGKKNGDNSFQNRGNDDIKKNDGDDKVKKNNGNDNGKKNDDNDKGKKNDNDNKGKKNDDNGRGNDDKGNGKGKK